MARRAADGHRISQVVIGTDGLLKGHYDKLHAAHYGFSMEKDFFVTGDSLFTFDVNGYRVAPIICYDIRFPELSRTLSLDHGAELILHCSAFGRDESFDSWHAFVTARAMENQVYVLGLSRAGTQWGGSVLAGPWVDSDHPLTRLPDHHESFTYLTIERSELDRVRNATPFARTVETTTADWKSDAGRRLHIDE